MERHVDEFTLQQEKLRAALAQTEALRLQRLAEFQAMAAIATVFENKLSCLQGSIRDMTLRLEDARKDSLSLKDEVSV
jgi:hypothetical protein